jgi:hypothetical protein
VTHRHEAIDHVRRGEHRALKREGDERLTGSKYLWLRRPADLPPEQRLVLRALPRENFKVGRACAPQGALSHLLEVPLSRCGPDLLHPPVVARDSQPAQTPGGRRQADPAASAEPAHLPAPSPDQCGPRRSQLGDPVGQGPSAAASPCVRA